ncbi:ATP-binding protein, partial [Streptomyces sp. YC504]
MTGAEWADPGARLYGRDRELAWCGRLLAQLGAGRGGSLVVTGDPGLGRTALLRHLAGTFTGGTACYVPAVPPRGLRGGVLGQLYAGHPAGRLRSALLSAARSGPLLVCVDDLHLWPDSPRAALYAVARGLAAESAPVALILSVAAHRAAGLSEDLPVLRLAPLDDAAADALLERLLTDRAVPTDVGDGLLRADVRDGLLRADVREGLLQADDVREGLLGADVREGLLRAAGGSPLVLRELVAGLALRGGAVGSPGPATEFELRAAASPSPATAPRPDAAGTLSPAAEAPLVDPRTAQALRLVEAAERARLEGRPDRAARLLAPVRRLELPDWVTGQVELVHGLLELGDGPIADARASLLLAARRLADRDPAQALRAHLAAAEASWAMGDAAAYREALAPLITDARGAGADPEG